MNKCCREWVVNLASLIVGLCAVFPASADTQPVVRVAGAYYLDARGFSTASVGLASDRLPLGLSLWGFTDFHGDHDSNDLELTRSFSEYRLSHSGVGELTGLSGLAFQAELNALSGSGNDLLRAGLTFKHRLSLPWLADADAQGWLQWRVFPYESDNNGGQASLIFNLPVTAKVHVKGFADYNVVEGGENRWVIEPELNVQLTQRLWGLLEYRYNQYEDANAALRGSSIAVGLRYHFSR